MTDEPTSGVEAVLRQALRNIAEGNLGDEPWQANYACIREVAAAALATPAATRACCAIALMPPASPAMVEARVRAFQEWLNDRRQADVSSVFHEIVDQYRAALATPAASPAGGVEAVLRQALGWYGEQARLARLIHSEGDAGRNALADDGGKRARAALATPAASPAPDGWPIATDDEVEALARACDWNNRRYMTPADYSIWCERMRKFARLASPSPAPAPETWRDLDGARLQRAIEAFYVPCEGTTIDGIRNAILAWERG